MSPGMGYTTRSAAAKRKRSPSPPPALVQLRKTPLSYLYLDGMDDYQIWNQLDLRASSLCAVLQDLLEGPREPETEEHCSDIEVDADISEGILELDSDPNETVGVFDEDADEDEDEDENEDEDEKVDAADDMSDELQTTEHLGEAIAELRDPSSDSELEDATEADLLDLDGRRKKDTTYSVSARGKKKGKASSLDDGFFDLAAFNAETEEAESRSISKGALADEDDDDEEAGSGDIDLFAPISVDAAFEEDDLEDADGGTFMPLTPISYCSYPLHRTLLQRLLQSPTASIYQETCRKETN